MSETVTRAGVTDPGPFVLSLADIRDLTVLELMRACSLAGVRRSEFAELTAALADAGADPELAYRAALLAYAVAHVRELRDNPAASWAQAQTRDLTIGEPDAAAEAVADDAARMLAEVAVLTGSTPEAAGRLTVRELDAYAAVKSGG
jgi:hypothetical protein